MWLLNLFLVRSELRLVHLPFNFILKPLDLNSTIWSQLKPRSQSLSLKVQYVSIAYMQSPSHISTSSDSVWLPCTLFSILLNHHHQLSPIVRIGFPRPQLLPSSAPDATIESLGLRHGDTVQASASISTTTDTTPPITPQPQTRTAPPQAPSKPTAPQQTGPPLTPSSSRQVSASVSLESGHLTLRLVPDDNSCLFRAVGLCLEQHQSSPNVSAKLRHIVADRVREDPVNWCEPVLGRSPELYVKKIMEVDVWGGAIGRSWSLSFFFFWKCEKCLAIECEACWPCIFDPSRCVTRLRGYFWCVLNVLR